MALFLAPAARGATGPADRTETDGGPWPRAVDHGARPDRRTGDGWRSRCLATAAYLLTLAGLLAVAATGTGTESDIANPINRNADRVVSSGLVGVLEQVLTEPAQP